MSLPPSLTVSTGPPGAMGGTTLTPTTTTLTGTINPFLSGAIVVQVTMPVMVAGETDPIGIVTLTGSPENAVGVITDPISGATIGVVITGVVIDPNSGVITTGGIVEWVVKQPPRTVTTVFLGSWFLVWFLILLGAAALLFQYWRSSSAVQHSSIENQSVCHGNGKNELAELFPAM